MALIDDIQTRFPGLCKETVITYFTALSFQNAEFWKCYFCFDYNPGDCNAEKILNLVAHLIVLESESAENDSSIKDVSSTSVGRVSESFVEHSGVFQGELKEFFSSTIYGQRYMSLFSISAGGGCAV